jgi:hypothetical protein
VKGVVRWRIVDLCQWIWEEFRAVVFKQTMSRELRALNYALCASRLSWGSALTRATHFGRGANYSQRAQEEICLLVQGETQEALDQLALRFHGSTHIMLLY